MAEQTKRTQLTDLVRDRRAELHLSLDRLAERCIDPDPESDTVLKSSWLHRLVNGLPVIPPQLPQLRALAAGLDLELSVIQNAAAAQFLGIDQSAGPLWSQDRSAQLLTAGMEDLSVDDLKDLADLLEVWNRSRKRRPDGSQQ
jgi:transcriptional regulator with XRE-family HTH domain